MLHHRGEPETASIRVYAEVCVVPEPEFAHAFDSIKRNLAGRVNMGNAHQLGIRIMDLTALDAVKRILPRQRHEIDRAVSEWTSELTTRVPSAVFKVADPRFPLHAQEDDLCVGLRTEGKESYLASIRRILSDQFEGRVRQGDRGCLSNPLQRLKVGTVNSRIYDDPYGDMAVYRKPVLLGFPSEDDYAEFMRNPNELAGVRSNRRRDADALVDAESGNVYFPEKISLAGIRMVSEVRGRNEKSALDLDLRRLQEELQAGPFGDWDE